MDVYSAMFFLPSSILLFFNYELIYFKGEGPSTILDSFSYITFNGDS